MMEDNDWKRLEQAIKRGVYQATSRVLAWVIVLMLIFFLMDVFNVPEQFAELIGVAD